MAEKTGTDDYYLSHKDELVEEFREVAREAVTLLEPEFGPGRARAIADEAVFVFEGLVPKFPDVGGERNMLSYVIPFAARLAAFYLPMKRKGKTAGDTGKLVYDVSEILMRKIPREIAIRAWEGYFSPRALAGMEQWAAWTRLREYPGNWVCTFVPGDGREFDFGIDYSECAVVKFLSALDMPELIPYVCINDFPDSAYHDSGLSRTKSIGYGDECCNFRYKKGRTVCQDWSTELPLIQKRAKCRRQISRAPPG